MRHTIGVLVENKPGVLARVAGLFSARGYNIASLAVSETLDPTMSYMTIVVEAEDERILEQIKKQLNKLIDVITISDVTRKKHIELDIIFAKIRCSAKEKEKIEEELRKYVAKVIQHKADEVLIVAADEYEKIEQLISILKQFKIEELVRTGRVAMA